MDYGPDGNYWKRALTRRRLLGTSVASVGSLAFLAACGGGSSATPTAQATAAGATSAGTTTAGAAASATATAAPKQGGRVNWGELVDLVNPAAPYSLDPPYSNLHFAIWDRLFKYESGDLKPVPRLASGFEFNGDQSQLTITLRDGLKFHDGQPIDAEAVVASYEAFGAKDTPPSQLTKVAAAYVDSVSAPDATHVLFKLKRPGVLVFDLLNFWTIADAKQIPDLAKGAVPNGSGPFKISSLSPKVGAKLDRFADFYAPALLDGIDYKVYPNAAGMTLALQSGELDIAPSLSVDDAKRLGKSGLPLYSVTPVQGGHTSFGANAHGAITKDERVRQALYHSMNQQHAIDNVYSGEASPSYSLWPDSSPAFEDRYKQDPYDVAKAKQLLSAAGYNGEQIDVYSASGRPDQTNIFTVFQADAKQAGINLSLTTADTSVWLPKWVKGDYPGAYEAGFGFNGMHPDTLFVMNYQVRVPNSATFDTPEYDQFQKDIAAATTDAERKAQYQVFNKLWDQYMWVFLWGSPKVTDVTSKRVQGYAPDQFDGGITFEKLWLSA
jgi:peptide/nickel transport system substrate-binding protein